MIKRLMIVFVFIFFLSCFFNATPAYAVTEKQRIVGQAIADFAAYVSSHNEDDFGYSFYFGSGGKKMESSIANRKKANELGIKYNGFIYFTSPQQAIQAGTSNQGSYANKFIVYCAAYAHLMVYHATGGYTVSEHGTNSFDALIPGDIVSVKYTDKGMNCGHTFVYIDDAGDDNPYTMTVAQAPGAETPDQAKRQHSIRTKLR